MTLRKVILAALSLVACGSPPSDEALLAEFQAHRLDYEHLRGMFLNDSAVGRVAYDFTRPANFFSGKPRPPSSPVSVARLAEYRRLFDRLSLTAGIEGYDAKHVIYFWRYTEGMGAGL